MTDPITAATPPSIPQGNEVYDMLMAKIEPDLVTTQLPLLDAKYKNETPAEAKSRSERYEKAFAEYDKQMEEYLANLRTQVRVYQSTARASVEHEERAKEEQELTGLEQAMSAI